jgi:chemotaxis response regulator CheB
MANMVLTHGKKLPPIFPVVCIGGSAGSLIAYIDILQEMPAKARVAIVIVSHRAPQDAGRLIKLLARATRMQVVEVTDGMLLEPGRVFVAPPQKEITTDGVALRISDVPDNYGWPTLIGDFLLSLARKCSSRAIVIIVSGMGYDGSGALAAVKQAGGRTFAQSDASYSSMPQAAIDTKHVDFVLQANEIGRYLASLSAHLR